MSKSEYVPPKDSFNEGLKQREALARMAPGVTPPALPRFADQPEALRSADLQGDQLWPVEGPER